MVTAWKNSRWAMKVSRRRMPGSRRLVGRPLQAPFTEETPVGDDHDAWRTRFLRDVWRADTTYTERARRSTTLRAPIFLPSGLRSRAVSTQPGRTIVARLLHWPHNLFFSRSNGNFAR